MHQGPATLGGHWEHRDGGLPLVELLFGLWKLGDVVGGVAQSHQRAPTRQQDRIIEAANPVGSGGGLGLYDQLSAFRDALSVRLAFPSAASTASFPGPIALPS